MLIQQGSEISRFLHLFSAFETLAKSCSWRETYYTTFAFNDTQWEPPGSTWSSGLIMLGTAEWRRLVMADSGEQLLWGNSIIAASQACGALPQGSQPLEGCVYEGVLRRQGAGSLYKALDSAGRLTPASIWTLYCRKGSADWFSSDPSVCFWFITVLIHPVTECSKSGHRHVSGNWLRGKECWKWWEASYKII